MTIKAQVRKAHATFVLLGSLLTMFILIAMGERSGAIVSFLIAVVALVFLPFSIRRVGNRKSGEPMSDEEYRDHLKDKQMHS